MPKRIQVAPLSRQTSSFSSASRKQTITLQWNTVDAAWYLSYAENQVTLLTGVRVVANVNLIINAPVTHVLFARNASRNNTDITFDSLIDGDTRLYFYNQADIAAAIAS